MNKIKARIRRAARSSAKIKASNITRLSVRRALKHMHAQIIKDNADGSCEILLSVTTIGDNEKGNKSEKAQRLGKRLAEQAKKLGVTKVGFDRRGCKYHGRVKALAEAVREGGLEF